MTKQCENFRCPADVSGGMIVPGLTLAGSETVLVCNEGFLLHFNNEPGIKITCTETGIWKSVIGDKMIHT